MTFKCKKCGKSQSNSAMIGLVAGQVTNAILKSKGIDMEKGFNAGQFSAGFLNGLRVKCPVCQEPNWE